MNHYEIGDVFFSHWADLNKQNPHETTVSFFEDVIRLAEPLHLPEKLVLHIFVDNLQEHIKRYVQLHLKHTKILTMYLKWLSYTKRL